MLDYVGTTPDDRMFASGLRRRACHKPIGSSPWIEWLQRETDTPELFVYFHEETGNYVLAAWLREPDIFKEITTFQTPPNLSGWGLPSLEKVQSQLVGVAEVARQVEENLRGYEYEERRKMGADHTRALEKARWFRKKGHDDCANMIEMAPHKYMGPEVGGERHAALTEEMTHLAADKPQVLIDKKLEAE